MEKIRIWENEIPGNSPRSKLTDMNIRGNPPMLLQLFRMMKALKGEASLKKAQIIDTFTYVACIKQGFEKETYEDEPYLTPYLLENSRKCVIIIPGGAYCYKQSDLDGEGKQSEGDLAAKELNKAGINAFVLWYRSNPYRMPVPLLDVQRAVRFIRYHAVDYGILPDNIGLLGFSAGGYQVAGFLNLLRGKNLFPNDYKRDVIDFVSDGVGQAAMGYPCLEFTATPQLLYAMYGAESVRDKQKQAELLKASDCILNLTSENIPQFIAYGSKDTLIETSQFTRYMNELKKLRCDCTLVAIDGAGHGFGAKPKTLDKYGFWIEKYVSWCNEHFI